MTMIERRRENAREGEKTRGAKIRMSVGMPLDGGGVYRVIQQERGRGRGRKRDRVEICEDSLFRPGTRPLRTRSGYAPGVRILTHAYLRSSAIY